jgi:ketosteroid isomerase-like protein
MDDRGTAAEVNEFVLAVQESADAYMRGDMERYLELITHVRGFTLLGPFGGPAARHEERAHAVRESAGYFQDGQARLESVEIHHWDDTLVLAAVERQHGRVGGLPDRDCSLRVTQVFRRENGRWLLVHRHADPLVRTIDLDQLSALMTGTGQASAQPDDRAGAED